MKQYVGRIPKRRADSHKGDYGHVLVIAGSLGLTGAAYLTSQAAILSGSGLVTCACPKSLNNILAVKLTEVMTLPVAETKEMSMSSEAEERILEFVDTIDVVAMGPGLSRNENTKNLVLSLVAKIEKPLVLDADGLNALEGNQDILKGRKAPTVLTPHPGEMSRLVGKPVSEIQKCREDIAKSVSKKYNCVTVLKGYRTVVSDPKGDIYINETGNSGMSTAGVGDILTGMIASLIGQGIDAYSSSVLSVYLHGKAGDLAAHDKGQFSMIATDVLGKLPHVFKEEA